jgi:class 3 adenylate cyclase
MQRRLAAILAADVVGYSRLMGADEMGTLTALKSHRRELVDSGVSEHHGRIVKTTGDGMLVEFASVVDAVACAVKIQRNMVRRNVGIPAEKQIVFRIGINVGDIIIDGDDIFGDGVNIAARLETLCEPGGVCISRAANDQIRDKLSMAFADLGEQVVKNISRAVGVFGLTAAFMFDASARCHRLRRLLRLNLAGGREYLGRRRRRQSMTSPARQFQIGQQISYIKAPGLLIPATT